MKLYLYSMMFYQKYIILVLLLLNNKIDIQ